VKHGVKSWSEVQTIHLSVLLLYPRLHCINKSVSQSALNRHLDYFVFFYPFFGQNESYREEFLNERKEKERVLSLKDKLKRDLENAQSRISSLQEQVGPKGNLVRI